MRSACLTTRMVKRLPCLELTVVGYGIWQSRNLAEAWLHSPFDRWGWLAFLIWLTPLVLSKVRAPSESRQSTKDRNCFLAGLLLTFLGDLGSFNVSRNVGLGLILLGFAPVQGCTWMAGLCSGAWMPALGWFGSQASLGPVAMSVLRLGIAVLGTIYALGVLRQRREGFRRAARPWLVPSGKDGTNAPFKTEQRAKVCVIDS